MRRKEFAPYGLSGERWRPHLMRKPDRHNEIELNLLQSGSIDLGDFDIPMFERWLRGVKEDGPQILEIILLEMEARLRRLALTSVMAQERKQV